MSDRQTIADSKRAFHSQFPHVIPALYRRTADELLVELHLLSHQKRFIRTDSLFAVGLVQVFKTFTRGYEPEGQLPELFNAICCSNGFDPDVLREKSDLALESVKDKDHKVEDVQKWITNQGEGAPTALADALKRAHQDNFHYSRLMAVGVLTLLLTAQGEDSTSPEVMREKAHELGEAMGFSKSRVKKDLSLYTTNFEKMTQAVELMEETLAAERRKQQKQESERTKDGQKPTENIIQGVSS